MAEPAIEGNRVRFAYTGLDGVLRVSDVRFAPAWRLSADRAVLELHLEPGEHAQTSWFVGCQVGERQAAATDFDAALGAVRLARRHSVESFPEITSNNEYFDSWIAGSLRDIAMLCAPRPTGPYVYAGIPWFATMFGRDGLLTAFETLAFAPALAAGTLRGLAAAQGSGFDPRRDEEPGKILHEVRSGEMAATGEVPFGRYYGSVDSTPLFLCLLGAYADRTGDLALVQELWPAALAAMECIERNLDARGYLAYERRTAKGLVNQGWKDSHDSISHADGRLAEPPIALCEVQAYVYAARIALAALGRRLGRTAEAEGWSVQAAKLRERFERDFWMPEERCYALALDRDGAPCRVVTSNAGHCLTAGIATQERAADVVARLMRDDCFCGWGVRTLSERARRFNPISYHNGSIWPHDNALLAAGFARYGFGRRAADLMNGLFDASVRLDERRLPELFCGFPRSQCGQPVPYPVACRPQAWAAGSAFLLLQAVLGLNLDAWKHRVTFSGTVLPEGVDYIDIRRLRLNESSVDVRVRRGGRASSVEILERTGELEVIVRK
jgi:glycogen debranching enzyme